MFKNFFFKKKKIFQTNDIVILKSKNTFRWIGRYDNIINTGGIKIIPELVENLIFPFIPKNRRFFIASISDKKFGEKLILVIEGKSFFLKIPNYIFYGEKKFFKPKKIFFVEKFSENYFGKIKKSEIVKML